MFFNSKTFTLCENLVIYFSAFLLFCFSVVLALCLAACNKEQVTESDLQIPTTEKKANLRISNGIDDDVDPANFETYLNANLTSSAHKAVYPTTYSIPFTLESGMVTVAEQTRVISEVEAIEHHGILPYVIDVDMQDMTVDVIFNKDDSGCCTGGPGETFPNADCVLGPFVYQNNYDLAFSCVGPSYTLSQFGTLTDIRPDGGIRPDGTLRVGSFCDNTPDPLGGGLGRISTTYNINNPVPDLHSNFDNIFDVTLFGAPNAAVRDGRPTVFELDTPELWYRPATNTTPPHPLCFDNDDLNDYYCRINDVIHDVIEDFFNDADSEFFPIIIEVSRIDNTIPLPGMPPVFYWQINMTIGESVSIDC